MGYITITATELNKAPGRINLGRENAWAIAIERGGGITEIVLPFDGHKVTVPAGIDLVLLMGADTQVCQLPPPGGYRGDDSD